MENKNDSKSNSEMDKLKNNNATAVNNLKEKHKNEKVVEAHEQADADMEQDADLSMGSPTDDLDEGEAARLGGDTNPIV